jgi:hypothetical protein
MLPAVIHAVAVGVSGKRVGIDSEEKFKRKTVVNLAL